MLNRTLIQDEQPYNVLGVPSLITQHNTSLYLLSGSALSEKIGFLHSIMVSQILYNMEELQIETSPVQYNPQHPTVAG